MKLNTLAELIRALDDLVESEYKREIAALAEQDLGRLHLGVNGLIRSLAFYKNESPEGKAWFGAIGLADDGSSVLGAIYWLHLRHEPVTAERIVELNKGETWFPVSEDIARSLATSYAGVTPQ
jgi:hypothetical protein